MEIAISIFAISALLLNTLTPLNSFLLHLKNFTISPRFYRPRITESSPGSFDGFSNNPKQFLSNVRVVTIDACDSRLQPLYPTLRFKWIIWRQIPVDPNVTGNGTPQSIARNDSEELPGGFLTALNGPFSWKTSDCKLSWQAPVEGNYTVTFSVHNYTSMGARDDVIASGIGDFLIRDIWIAAIGDSFASGQGNPDARVQLMGLIPAKWISKTCFRSANGSWAYRVYKRLEETYPEHGILFTYIACSGATINRGLLGTAWSGTFRHQSQLDTLVSIQAAAKLHHCYQCQSCCDSEGGSTIDPVIPDVLLMSIGGNDIQFGDIMQSMMAGQSAQMFQQISSRFEMVEKSFHRLARQIESKLGPLRPGSLFIPHYYDITRNERGIIDAKCPGLYRATTEAFSRANREVLQRINSLITKISSIYNWTCVDQIMDIFRQHGICSKNSFIRTIDESYSIQGNCYGAFHPTTAGHGRVADRVWAKLSAYLEERRFAVDSGL